MSLSRGGEYLDRLEPKSRRRLPIKKVPGRKPRICPHRPLFSSPKSLEGDHVKVTVKVFSVPNSQLRVSFRNFSLKLSLTITKRKRCLNKDKRIYLGDEEI